MGQGERTHGTAVRPSGSTPARTLIIEGMTTMWNYRVIEIDGLYAVSEVYYDDNGLIEAWALPDDLNPLTGWETIDELRGTVDLIKEAFNRPVIKGSDLPS
jgi:hypothetical protein